MSCRKLVKRVLVLSVLKEKKKKKDVLDGRALKQKWVDSFWVIRESAIFLNMICITIKSESRLMENNTPGMHVNTQNLRAQNRDLGNSKMHKEDNKNEIIYGH